MIVPFPISISTNFTVGVKYVVVEFQFSAGDDSQEVITHFIQKENIPIYLESNIKSAVESFLCEVIQSEKDEEDERCVLEGEIFIKQAKKWSHALIDSNLKWNLLNHPNLATPRSERSESVNYVGFIPAYQWIVGRSNGINTLLKLEQSYASAVILLRQGMESALDNLRTRLSKEMDSLVKTMPPEQIPDVVAKHVEEMDLAQKKWKREIEGLKKRQKQEYQNFVKEYYQSEQLLSTVNDSLHSPSPSILPDPVNPATSPPPSSSSSSSFSSFSSITGPTPAPPTPSVSESSSSSTSSSSTSSKFIPTKKFFSNLTSQFGKPKPEPVTIDQPTQSNTPPSNSGIFPPSSSSLSSSFSSSLSSSLSSSPNASSTSFTNLPSSPVPSPLYNNDPLYFLNKEAREISKKLFFHETIPVYLGRQRKNLFYFKIFSGELIEFCSSRERHLPEKREEGRRDKEDEEEGDQDKEKGSRWKQRSKMASSLYGASLSGVVLLVSPDLSYKSDTCREFVNICGTSTDFHFETFKEQLAKVKGANTRLNSGDFFITKHSNLLHTSVVFHLVVDSVDAALQPESATFSVDSNAALGLRNILLTASQCDVHSLVIPAALSEPSVESISNYESSLFRRLDIVTKTVRSALTSIGDGGSLKTIQFVVRHPNHSNNSNNSGNNEQQPLYKKLKSLLTASSKTQQPVYKI